MARPPRPTDEHGRYQCPGPPYKGCGRWLMPHEFYPNKKTKTGISAYCKECHREKQNQQYSRRAQARLEQERRERAEAILKEYHAECEDRKTFGLPLRTYDEFLTKMGYDAD